MRRQGMGYWARGVGVAVVLLTMVACDNREKNMIKDPVTGQLVMPVVTARIGDTWDEVQKHSTLPLKPLWFNGAGITVEEPHNFVYRGPDHEMMLENVWYMGVSTSPFWGG